MTSLADIYAARAADGHIDPDPAQEAALVELERIRAALAEPAPRRGLLRRRKAEAPPGLYLWGGVGRGKSMLMDLFADHLEVPSRRVHFHAFMQEVHAGMHAARAKGVDDALAPVADALVAELRCLALDEMQITDITDAMIVGRLFQRLLDGGVAVVTTSNRPPDDLYKDGLNRAIFEPFIEMLKERLVVWELISPHDYRQRRIAGERRYFAPVTPEHRAAVEAIWEHLTGGVSHPMVLKVQGREVELPAFHNGVARASFYTLCGRALGPADYLRLAETVRVLVIDEIPRLSRSNYNEARRFVTLVDALYEARVQLICTAAAEPDMLYIEGEGTFEFARTASRLVEMQSEGWGEA